MLLPKGGSMRLHLRFALTLFLIEGALSCGCNLTAQDAILNAIQFTEIKSAVSGITFKHDHGGSDRGYIVEGVAAGLATFDYDNDGLIDIFLINGKSLPGTPADPSLRSALYRNNGDWTFKDVTNEAGVGNSGYGLGVVVADYDGDGDEDIYVNNFGPNVLYRNNGDRTFTDVTEEAGVANGNKVGAGASFFDMEGDGDLDLYVANYVDFTFDNHIAVKVSGNVFRAGPQYYQPVADTLYRNDGAGKFTDVSLESGIGQVAGPSMGMVCADFDNDHDTDVYICNDLKPNFLFLNDGQGHFEEVGLLHGVACDFEGRANSSMGLDVGDYNRDGWLDIITTNYQAELPALYRNLGGGLFEDASTAAGITYDLFPHVNWGCALSDFDNDADQDLFIACGHFDRIEQIDDRTAEKVRNFLLMNVAGRFMDVSNRAGDGMAVVESSRGAAFDDLDNDGDIDVVVLNSMASPTLLRNDSMTNHHWLELKLQQPGLNRDAVGARVSVTDSKGAQVAEVIRGRGYQSHFGSRLHFGLGNSTHVTQVEIRWPDGAIQSQELDVDRLHIIKRDGR